MEKENAVDDMLSFLDSLPEVKKKKEPEPEPDVLASHLSILDRLQKQSPKVADSPPPQSVPVEESIPLTKPQLKTESPAAPKKGAKKLKAKSKPKKKSVAQLQREDKNRRERERAEAKKNENLKRQREIEAKQNTSPTPPKKTTVNTATPKKSLLERIKKGLK